MSFLSQVCTAAARRSTLPFFIAFSVAVLHVVPVAAQTVRCAKGTLPTAARVGLPTSSVAAAGQNSISSVSRDAGALVRGGQSVSSLGADLFGDSVNLYTGSFSISQSDVSIPGNSALPVSLGRAFSAKDGRYTSGAFGDWDLELPSIGGQFATGTRNGGWDTINNKGTPQEHQRCTYFGEPELAASNDNDAWWEGFEYWQGSTLNVPGGGNQEVLWRASGNTTVPADGNAWPLVTKSGWQLRCLPGLHAANINTSRFAKGEGFMAKAPDGTTYRFDWLVVRPTKVATRGKNGVTRYLIRSEVAILPTLITDAFGNTVTYSYNPQCRRNC